MIDTDKYEGCQTDSLVLHKGYLCPTIFMDVDSSGKNVPTLGRGIVDVQADIPEHYLQLLADAPLLLEEVKRLQEEVRRLRNMVCLLEDSRITNMSIHDRPELFADVAEVFRQRNEDTHGHLPNFGEEE